MSEGMRPVTGGNDENGEAAGSYVLPSRSSPIPVRGISWPTSQLAPVLAGDSASSTKVDKLCEKILSNIERIEYDGTWKTEGDSKKVCTSNGGGKVTVFWKDANKPKQEHTIEQDGYTLKNNGTITISPKRD